MKKYEVTYTHVIEREITAWVLASSEEEAIEKCQNGDFIEDDEEFAPEQGIETKNYKATELEEPMEYDE
jgi:hypothetical protein